MKKIILSIGGMTCSACSNGLEKYLNKQTGISKALVNLLMANASIEYDENVLKIDDIERYIKEAGFESLGEFKEIKSNEKNKKEKIIFFIMTIFTILLMYIAMAHILNLPIINILNINIYPKIYSLVLFLSSVIYIIYGFDIIKNGYKNLIHKTPNMDTLVTIGVLSSLVYSVYSFLMIFLDNMKYTHNLYFESVIMIIYFIKLGRYIEGKSTDKTKEAISKLVTITPDSAVIKVNDKEKNVTINEIKKGDIVVCRAGEKIAVDGEIILGQAHLDESFITGESRPILKNIGDKVVSGSINYNGYLEYKAEKIGKESTISEIVKLVMESIGTKTSIEKIVDKVSGVFVPIVIIISIITFIAYLLLGYSFSESLITFVTVLVVVCPCGLGLATPLSIVVSQGLCINKGILVKKNDVLEKVKNINTVVFDKTGTLTYGKLKISEILNYTDMDDKEILKIVCSIEDKSNHPIANAFKEYAKDNNLEKVNIDNIEEISGYGITGIYNNKRYILGNVKILEKYDIKIEYSLDEKILSKKGNSIIYVVKEDKIIALIGVNDIIRNNVRELISKLHKKNIDVIMLTGDNEDVALKIAKDIEIENVISNVLPVQKSDIIKQIKKDNKIVMMCGDGINDSPALANADIGVSLNTASDIAINTADVVLTNNNLMSINSLIKISNNTIRNIKQNLFWVFAYNTLMMLIAIGIFKPLGISINPMIASLAMVFSSITVTLNALRLRIMR